MIVRNHGDARGAILIGGSSSDGRDLTRWEHRVDCDLSIIGRLGLFAILVIGEHRVDRDRTVHAFDISSDDPDTSWKNSTIAARSNRDCGAIDPRSKSERGGIASTTK